MKIKAIRRNPTDQAKKEETQKLFNRLAMNTHMLTLHVYPFVRVAKAEPPIQILLSGLIRESPTRTSANSSFFTLHG